jgi:hypothetical protein
MHSDCMATWPYSINSYTWKNAAAMERRTVPFPTAELHLASRAIHKPATEENVSVSWKAYLASRQLQNMASDLADAIFSGAGTFECDEASYPESLLSPDSAVKPGAGGQRPCLLLPAVPPSGGEPAETEAPSLVLPLAA